MTDNEEKQSRFMKDFDRLEEIVRTFEQGELDIEEGLKLYKESAGLVKTLQERLEEVENEIEQVQKQTSNGKDAED